MMVWPRKMFYSIIDLTVRVACSLCAKLPYRPFGTMFIVEKFDKCVGWVAVSALGICRGWAGGGDD